MNNLKHFTFISLFLFLTGCPPQNNEIIQEPANGLFSNLSSINYTKNKLYLLRTHIYPSPWLIDSTKLTIDGNFMFNHGLPRIYEKEASCNGDLTPGGMDDFTILFPYNDTDTLIFTFHEYSYKLNEGANYVHNADTIISIDELNFNEKLNKWLIPEISLKNLIE